MTFALPTFELEQSVDDPPDSLCCVLCSAGFLANNWVLIVDTLVYDRWGPHYLGVTVGFDLPASELALETHHGIPAVSVSL